jgi:transcriptional regulator with XRE-family HTH domain
MPNQRLKRERQLRGWSQAYLAEQIDVPSYYLSRWERRGILPSSFYQQKLCDLFGKSAEELGFLPGAVSGEATLLEKSLDLHPLPPTPEIKSLSGSLLRKPSTLLVVSISRSWLHRRVIPLVIILLIMLSLSTSGRMLLNTPMSPVGSFSFSNSGVDKANSSQGMADEVVLSLHLDRQSAAGAHYYAWLLPDQNNPEGPIAPLGTLSLQGTTGHLSYHDLARTNLLLSHSTLLITEQASSPLPQAPSLDQADWRYQVVIDQQMAPGTPYSLLDHLRHLFALDPELESVDLHGGLVSWLSHTTTQLAILADDAEKQRHNASAYHQDLLHMLAYLDGTDAISQDLPGSVLPVDPYAKIGLLTLYPDQPIPGYLQHIENHLRGITTSPGVSARQHILANQFLIALDRLTAQAQAIRISLLYLLKNTNASLLSQAISENTMHVSKDAQQDAVSMVQLLSFPIS